MQRRPGLSLVLGIGLLAVLPAPASAQMSLISQSGAWTAMAGLSSGGRPMCLLRAEGRSTGRSLYLKYLHGSHAIVVHAVKLSWSIPANARIPVEMGIDNAPGWTATATRMENLAAGIEWLVGLDVMDCFEAQFRAGRQLILSFPSGTEEPWEANLSGSNAMMGAFNNCIRRIYDGTPTQPHGGTSTTQPHSTPPTQPYVSGAPLSRPAAGKF